MPPLGLPPADGGPNRWPSCGRTRRSCCSPSVRPPAIGDVRADQPPTRRRWLELCRRLDGLPLAIELAAVRTRVLTAEQILDRLTDRFAPADRRRPGGAAAAADAADDHRLESRPADAGRAALLRRLCVFAGRFTLDDLEAVCASGTTTPVAALDLLSSLVDKSLVAKEDVRAVACYRLHETMREYAALKLSDAAEDGPPRRRLRRVLPGAVRWTSEGDCSAPPARLAALGRAGDRQHLACPAEVPGRLRLAAWARASPPRSATTGPRAAPGSRRWFDELLAAAGGRRRTFLPGRTGSADGSSMRRADAEAARPWLVRAIAAARASGRPSTVGRGVGDRLDRGEHGRTPHGRRDSSSTRRRPSPPPGLPYPASDRGHPGESRARVLRGRPRHRQRSSPWPVSGCAGKPVTSTTWSRCCCTRDRRQCSPVTSTGSKTTAGRGAAGRAADRRPSGPVRPADPAGLAGQHDRSAHAWRRSCSAPPAVVQARAPPE